MRTPAQGIVGDGHGTAAIARRCRLKCHVDGAACASSQSSAAIIGLREIVVGGNARQIECGIARVGECQGQWHTDGVNDLVAKCQGSRRSISHRRDTGTRETHGRCGARSVAIQSENAISAAASGGRERNTDGAGCASCEGGAAIVALTEIPRRTDPLRGVGQRREREGREGPSDTRARNARGRDGRSAVAADADGAAVGAGRRRRKCNADNATVARSERRSAIIRLREVASYLNACNAERHIAAINKVNGLDCALYAYLLVAEGLADWQKNSHRSGARAILKVPGDVGAKVTVKLQLAPALIVKGQLLVVGYTPGLLQLLI